MRARQPRQLERFYSSQFTSVARLRCSHRWMPRRGNEPIALPILLHVTEAGERGMEELHHHLVGYEHVQRFAPRLLGHVRNLIEERVPARVAYKKLRPVGYVGEHEYTVVA